MVTLYHSARRPRPSVMMTEGPILAYCPACQFTARTPYPYHGSRYGHVGGFRCEQCGADVTLTDRDCYPPVTYHARPTPAGPAITETILYEELYRINEPDFRRLERWTGLTLLGQGDQQPLKFEQLVTRVAAEVQRRGLPHQPARFALPFVTWVPEPFGQWLDLYATLERHHGP
ncbi:hypothetical protein [Deinococcus hohokamensis]|uniref:Transposase n=1 Tax=Deinococcus hohokamensis TaxID=309883 RepID=A0ABV9IAE9_9DEIO